MDIAAKGSCVIIGRCASAILREAGFDIISVFVYADKDDRVQRIVARNGGDVKAAARKMQKLDRMRKHYFDFYAGTTWGEPESYDLMLSTSRYGIDGVADIIKNIVTKGKREIMKEFLGILMELSLDAAMLTLVVSLARHTIKGNAYLRLLSVTMGIGFAIGIVGRCIDGASALLILDVLGLAFSCVAAFFTFQKTYQEDEDQQ